MELFQGILIIVLYIVLFIVLRIVTTFIHEMGHAIPALMYTNEPVTIYIGSYGDITNSTAFQIGRLQILFQFNLLSLNMGLCSHNSVQTLWQEFLVIVGGPTFSVLLSIPLLLFMAFGNLNEGWIIVFLMFVLSAFIDFFVNIIPNNNRMVLHNGKVTYNDGYQMQKLLAKISSSEQYMSLEKTYFEGRHRQVIAQGQSFLEEGHQEKGIYDLMIKSYKHQGQYEEALQLYDHKKSNHKLTDDDFYQLGHIHMHLKNNAKALDYFDQYKHKHFQDAIVLKDMGYIKFQQGRHQEAVKDLDAAIHYTPEFLDAYLLRGETKLEMKNLEGAHQDFLFAQQIEKNDPRIPLYLGMYEEASKNFQQALTYYQLAKELQLENFQLDEKIAFMKQRIADSQFN